MAKKTTPKKIEKPEEIIKKEPVFQDQERLYIILFKAFRLVDQTNNVSEKVDIIKKAIEAEFNLEAK